ncbi:MAG: hypothetical protein AAFO99_14980 [Bacteroidota bacterium]
MKLLEGLRKNSYIDEKDFDYVAREIIYKIKNEELGKLKENYKKLRDRKFESDQDYDNFREFMIIHLSNYLASS